MAKSKKDLNILFKGKEGDLVIKLNGKVIFPFQEEQVKKEISPKKLKTQLVASVAAGFSGAVNRIIPLRNTWKRWPVKSRTPYRNILAANIKRCTEEHPTLGNMICPYSGLSLQKLKAVMDAKGLKIEVGSISKLIELAPRENMVTIAGILCLYDPREKEFDSCLNYPLNAPIDDFELPKDFGTAFLFNEDMANNISMYEKCRLYVTVLIGLKGGSTKRWFGNNYVEYNLQNDIKGKFERGVNIRPD